MLCNAQSWWILTGKHHFLKLCGPSILLGHGKISLDKPPMFSALLSEGAAHPTMHTIHMHLHMVVLWGNTGRKRGLDSHCHSCISFPARLTLVIMAMCNSSASVLLVLMAEELCDVFQVIFFSFSLSRKPPALHLCSFFSYGFPTWHLCGLLHGEQ